MFYTCLSKFVLSKGWEVLIAGRTPELTIKFTEKPELPEQGKKVALEVKAENGAVVRAEVNRKTLKKQLTKAETEGWDSWIAVLSGKMSSFSEEGVIELEGAGVSIFGSTKLAMSNY